MTALDYRYRCPATGCPWAAAVVGEAWTGGYPAHRRWRLRYTAGHRLTVDLLPKAVAA